MLNIGERIRECREKLDMTQDELAKLTGYRSRSSINKIEKGGNDLPQSKIVIFAKVLKITPSYLMGWESWDKEAESFEDTDPVYTETTESSVTGEELREILLAAAADLEGEEDFEGATAYYKKALGVEPEASYTMRVVESYFKK